MSVLIKGMKMPEKCGLCDLFHAESPMHCTVVKWHKTVGAPYGMPRPEWCPLIALPDHHGRLIDENEVRTVMNWLLTQPQRPTWNDLYHSIQEMNAVIEAEDG